MTIVFYDCKTAPSPRRARILLAEKGVPHEVTLAQVKRTCARITRSHARTHTNTRARPHQHTNTHTHTHT